MVVFYFLLVWLFFFVVMLENMVLIFCFGGIESGICFLKKCWIDYVVIWCSGYFVQVDSNVWVDW